MENLVSRQAAIEAWCKADCGCKREECHLTYERDGTDACAVVRFLQERPAVEPKQGEWIPCKKQMPKPNGTVNWVRKYYLVQNEYGDMMVASYRAKGDKTWWEQMYRHEPITDEIVAWMELPEEYKEGGEDEHTD